MSIHLAIMQTGDKYKQQVEVIVKHQHINVLITILWTLFIFTQSLLPGEVSSNQSGFIVDILHPFVQRLGFNVDVNTFSFIIRKLAHFTEYFILGVLLFFAYRKYLKSKMMFSIIFLQGLLTASIDETIQIFTPNRSGELRDVLIDISGVMIASMLLHTIYLLNKKKARI
jgi:VanZ family protein